MTDNQCVAPALMYINAIVLHSLYSRVETLFGAGPAGNENCYENVKFVCVTMGIKSPPL